MYGSGSIVTSFLISTPAGDKFEKQGTKENI
jgi:hypothetical protein